MIGCSTPSSTDTPDSPDTPEKLSSVKQITSFSVESLSVTGVIDETAKEITLTFDSDTDITALVPTVQFNGVSLTPNTGVAQDFSRALCYTVTAEDNTSQAYSIKVNMMKKKIAYIYKGSICTMNYDGSNKATIFQQAGTDYCTGMSYSTATKKIALSVEHNKQYENIMTMNIDGTGLDNLTDTIANGQFSSEPSFSPDGGKIVYSFGNTSSGLYVMNADGSGKTLLASSSGSDWYESPCFSSTGTKVFFINEYNKSYSNIYGINVDGTNMVNITNNSTVKTFYSDLSTAHDADTLVVIKRVDTTTGDKICTISTTGTNEKAIVSSVSPNWFYQPRFFPNENKILFIDDYGKTYSNIKAVDGGGATIQNLTNTTAANDNYSYPFVYEAIEGI